MDTRFGQVFNLLVKLNNVSASKTSTWALANVFSSSAKDMILASFEMFEDEKMS